ncbi:MAG TPA: hypothetical protein VNG90_05820 [Candidatus Acidoferrum sp.]|nr:hypothetical protein [Candidatus Acidoferrum sp.]
MTATAKQPRLGMGMNTGALILLAATVYESLPAAIGELARNAYEAGASTCWIEFLPGSVNVCDNGHGMTDKIKPSDRRTIRRFEHWQFQRSVPVGYSLIANVSDVSKKTIEWYWTKFGYSPKVVNGIQTNLGVGSKAIYYFATDATVYSKPTPKLAHANWGKAIDAVPLLCATLPTMEELGNNQVDLAEPEWLTEPLVSPLGDVLEHGTLIQTRGVTAELRPGAYAPYYATRFADVLKTGCRLILIDKVTEAGRAMGGRIIEVTPPTYRGRTIIDDRFTVGDSECHIVVYYDPEQKASTLQIRRQGEDVNPLTVLEAFQTEPWLQGLNGFVEYLVFRRLWDPRKTTPLETSTRAAWIKKLKGYEHTIRQAAEAGAEEQTASIIREAKKGLEKALLGAMQDLPAFSDFVPPPLEPVQVPIPTERPSKPSPRDAADGTELTGRRGQKAKDQDQKTKNNIGVTVTSNNKGVPNIEVKLQLPDGTLVQLSTDSWGRILFSSDLAGRFVVGVVDAMVDTSISPPIQEVTLPSPRIQWVHFALQAEAEDEMIQPPPQSIFGVFEMPMPGRQIYETRMAAGQIVINSNHPNLLRASATGDIGLVRSMLMLRLAAAIAAQLKGDAKYIAEQTIELADMAMLRLHSKK